MNYLEWNDSIAKYFFNESKAGQEVLLYVTDDVINSIGQPSGVGVDDFINSVKMGPESTAHLEFCQKALYIYRDWRNNGYSYPPYISYLAFFVLAAVTNAGYAPHAYYPGLRKLLGEPLDSGMPRYFDRMGELWDDLSKWSNIDNQEAVGRFSHWVRGGHRYIGLPRSQTVLSENERKYLPNLFERAGLNPGDAPSSDAILKSLRDNGDRILEHRTFLLVESNDKGEGILQNALVGFILEALDTWDGEVRFQIPDEEPSSFGINTGLRLCVKIDSLAKKATINVRLKTNLPFPEEGLNFQGEDGRIWFCKESHEGWSTYLEDKNDPRRKLNGIELRWETGTQLIDNDNHWRSRLRGSSIRLFRLDVDGLPGYVETQRLERGREFLIMSAAGKLEVLKRWGAQCCELFEQKDYMGLPDTWFLFRVKNAQKSCPGIDLLSVSTTMRIQLKEGIKSGRGNVYFKFAPPKIVIENGLGNEKVKMNEVLLNQPKTGAPEWVLPSDAPVGRPIRIEVNVEDQILSKTLWLGDFGLGNFDEAPFHDFTGNICTNDIPVRACGALVYGLDKVPPCPYVYPTHISDRIIFLGELPGEIADWPHEDFPTAWRPVWAVAVYGPSQREVYFCGNPEDLSRDFSNSEFVVDNQVVQRWREAIWFKRKITTPPKLKELLSAWNSLVRRAKDGV